jgi:NitT/TauT family transport system substrate-binding protein
MAIILSENFRALFYSPFYAANANGFYEAAGVDVTLKTAANPGEAHRALLAGQVDVIWGGPLRVLIDHQADPKAPTVCFADVVARDPFFVVGPKPRPDFKLADLTSLKLATVSEVPTPWICLQQDLRDAGVDPAKVSRITTRSMGENEAELATGRIDAIQVFQPFAERLVASGKGHIWFAQASRGLTAYTTLVTRRDVLEKRSEELLRMTRAIHKALGWFAATPAPEIAAKLQSYFPDLDPKIYAAAIERYRGLKLWNSTPVVGRAGFERLKKSMLSDGTISRDIPFEECVDTAIAEKAVATAK